MLPVTGTWERYTVYKFPELTSGEWVDTCGWFVKYEQVRVVDQGTAKTEFLFHSTGKFPCWAILKGRKPCALKECVNPCITLLLPLFEQSSEKTYIFKNR